MRERRPREIWHDERIERVASALAIALAIALVVGFFGDREGKSLLRRGDFPGFYAPAFILAMGENERLYDEDLQRGVENESWPSLEGDFYMSVYPPYFVAVLYPLALLPPLQARLVFGALALAAYGIACRLAAGFTGRCSHLWPAFAVLCLLVAPVFVAVFGGQNTPFSMALYAAAIYFASRGTGKGDLLAGVALGAWLYKPQFGLIALAVPLARRRWRILLGAAIPATVYALLGVAVSGLDWPSEWLEAVARFAPRNFVSNRMEMASVPGLFAALGVSLDPGILRTAVSAIGSLAVLGLGAHILVRAVRSADTATALIALGPSMALLSPQTLFYDMGIPMISCLFLARLERDAEAWGFLIFALLCGAATLLRADLPVTPFPFLVVLMLLYVERRLGRGNGSPAPASTAHGEER